MNKLFLIVWFSSCIALAAKRRRRGNQKWRGPVPRRALPLSGTEWL